ncbi:MFS transporter [Lachnoclostridium phytofermentans]|uniref:Major facilitator superfamily MFS_1 n=1 Tax=Lachnoclostridium phytofermentans (strain ATCC 700394 / DSM 18823 / ISDg) TaxID=357809 RepID=A9KPG9_LACP7|nr:MFS transporter [Lachnoclostridium phytofermentans]ABX43243.1 major facilitator superfamily MFS_1 [Lachnoclostridium phytofermentans ISDg]
MKLNYKRTFFVGLAFLSICSFWQLYDNIIPLILKNTFGIGETVTGVIMALDNVLALFLLPLFGILSDRTNTRWGRRTPFIVVGTIASTIFMMIIPIADQNKQFVVFIIALGLVLLSMGTYRSPAVALMPDLTPKPLRSMANAIINLMGAVGGLISLVLIMIFVKKEKSPDYVPTTPPNYIPLYTVVALIMLIAVIVLLVTIRENKMRDEVAVYNADEPEERIEVKNEPMKPEVKRSLIFLVASIFLWFTAYNAVTTAFSRYTEVVWKLGAGGFTTCLLVATGAAIVSYIPIGIIASKIGRKKTILIGISLITFSYVCGCFFAEYSSLINVVFAITGIGWAAINVNSYPMIVEMSKGSDVGKYTGYYYTFSMTAQIMTPILSGALLEFVSYRTLFPYAVFFSVGSFITMLFVKHGDAKPEKKQKMLENFDVED